MIRRGAVRGSARRAVAVGVLLTALVLLAPLAASTAAAYSLNHPGAGAAPGSSGLSSVTVDWEGHAIGNANQPSSAFSISKGQTATVTFVFVEASAGLVRNVSLQLTYLGIVLTTSRAAPAPVIPGLVGEEAAGINWSFGPLYDALEGVFQFTASLVYANGSTAWSQTFYVFAKAPYLLESGAVVVLIILAIAELYWGSAAIRDARRGAKPPATGTTGTAPPTSPGGPSSPPAPDAGAAGAPPASPPTPPPGGGGPS